MAFLKLKLITSTVPCTDCLWPDTVGGLNRLKSQFIIATLSNGNVSLLTNMAKHAGLPWDAVFSAELAQHYKPDQRAYLKAVDR